MGDQITCSVHKGQEIVRIIISSSTLYKMPEGAGRGTKTLEALKLKELNTMGLWRSLLGK